MLVEFKEVVEEGGKGLNAVLQERTQFKRANVSYISGEEIKDRPDELRAETSIFEGLCLKVAVNDLAELQVTTCYMSTIPIYHLWSVRKYHGVSVDRLLSALLQLIHHGLLVLECALPVHLP